jgi:uncharacterized membrane protein
MMFQPDQHLAIFAALITLSAMAFWIEKTRLGAALTGTVLVILFAIIAANAGVIPHNAPVYGFVFEYLVPVLIPLFLLQGDVRRLLFEASRTTLAFFIAALATVAGVLLAVSLLDLSTLATASSVPIDRREAAIAGLFASTYIGGSVNYAALGEMTGLIEDRSFFAAATAADNLFSAVYLSLLGLIPGISRIARYFSKTSAERDHRPAVNARENDISPRSMCTALALSVSLVAITDVLIATLDLNSARYIILTILTLMIATMIPQVRRWSAGGFEMGVMLSFVFFASIAAGADIRAMLNVAPILVLLVGILLSTHLLCLLVVGKWLKLTLPELLTASNAAILGATTAPAMAAAKGWDNQVTPGVLVGVLGYALGTLIGGTVFALW